MSEDKNSIFRPDFNRSVIVDSVDDSLSGNAGVLLLREVDHKLHLSDDLVEPMFDNRREDRVRYPLGELLRERIYGFACGYCHQDDADELAHDPAFRVATWGKAGDGVKDERLASQPTQSRLTELLSMPENLERLRSFLSEPVIRHRRVTADAKIKTGTLDIDAFPVTVYGQQEGAAYNGYYDRKVYAPYAAYFSPSGNLDDARLGSGFLHACLRNGDAGPASGAVDFILEAHEKSRAVAEHTDIRADAAFAIGKVLDRLTDESIHFLMRIKNNETLKQIAAENIPALPASCSRSEEHVLTMEMGLYQAASWKHPQRLVLVVVYGPDENGQQTLFPNYFFLVTSWSEKQRNADELLAHYRQRGTFEDRFGELSQSLRARLSSRMFAENEATLLLSFLGFNFAEILRREIERATGNGWDLGRVQATVLRSAARLARGGNYLRFLLMLPFVKIWTMLANRIKSWRPLFEQPVERGRTILPPPAHAFHAYHPRL